MEWIRSFFTRRHDVESDSYAEELDSKSRTFAKKIVANSADLPDYYYQNVYAGILDRAVELVREIAGRNKKRRESAVAGLTRLKFSHNYASVLRALQELGATEEEIFRVHLNALKCHTDSSTVKFAIECLGESADPQAVDALMNFIDSGDLANGLYRDVPSAIVKSLRKLGTSGAVIDEAKERIVKCCIRLLVTSWRGAATATLELEEFRGTLASLNYELEGLLRETIGDFISRAIERIEKDRRSGNEFGVGYEIDKIADSIKKVGGIENLGQVAEAIRSASQTDSTARILVKLSPSVVTAKTAEVPQEKRVGRDVTEANLIGQQQQEDGTARSGHHDVFICHASEDKVTADAVCARLEARRIRCWIAPRDILPGLDYAEAIVDALDDCSVIVLVFSSNANCSPHVRNEIERAVSKGVSVLPFRVEDVQPSRKLELHLSSCHWLDALTPPLERHLDRLADAVDKLVRMKKR